MSDTHDLHHKINVKDLPNADIFIHCGDFTKASSIGELARFRQFLTILPYKHKIVVAGNHDFNLDKNFLPKESKRAKQ
jgi:predicted phosphodiesterase